MLNSRADLSHCYGRCASGVQVAGQYPEVANKHYLTVTEDHFQMAAGGVGQSEDENWGLTGDKLGMQPPAERGRTAQKKSRTITMARENVSFSEVVGILKNTLVAEEGLELLVRFRGKTYVLTKAGDQLGIISEKARS